MTPRVVLRLPDLDALSAVAVGPPTTAKRRRIDSAHVVERASESSDETLESPAAKGAATQQFVNFLRGPVLKSAPPWLAGGAALLGKAIVVLQQPRMALAAIFAIGLQLAAVLAMLVGNGKTTTDATPGTNVAGGSTPVAVQAGPNDPIQTPLTVFGGRPPSSPPQTLPGLDAGELPPWPTDAKTREFAGPAVGGANTPATLPTLAPPQRFAPPPAAATSETLPTLAGPNSAPTVETSDAVAGKPKARLQGTIKKISNRGTTP